MNVWNKVFLGLIIFVSLVFFYFAADILRTHEYWRTNAKQHEKRITELEGKIKSKRYGVKGDETEPGLLARQSELYKVLLGRGREWYNTQPQMVDPAKGEVRVTGLPTPHGITDKTVLAVFDENPTKAGGRYVGQFVVNGVGEKQVGLVPSRALRPEALTRITSSRGPWTLCEILPSDDHDVFAGIGPDQLAEILPQSTLEEYVKDGKNGFQRKLRDYQFLLDNFERQIAMLAEARNSAVVNQKLMKEAEEDATRQVKYRQAEIAALEKELTDMERQRDIVLAHEKALDVQIENRTEKIQKLIRENRRLAAQIAKDQLEAVRRVDIQTASVE